MRWILVASMALMWGCGGDDDDDGDGGASAGGSGGSGGAADVAAVNCQPRCEAVLTMCGQGAGASVGCSNVVCPDATEQQLTCLEGTSCDAILASISSGMDICGIGDDGAGGGTGECPELECACGVSGVVEINGQCATTCEEACAAFGS